MGRMGLALTSLSNKRIKLTCFARRLQVRRYNL